MLDFLIDTGASKNFIRQDIVTKTIPVEKVFKVASVGGTVLIRSKVELELFKDVSKLGTLEFFVLPTLRGF